MTDKVVRINRDGEPVVHISGEIPATVYEAMDAYRWEHKIESFSGVMREWLDIAMQLASPL